MEYIECSICASNPAGIQTARLDQEHYICDQCSKNRILNTQAKKQPAPDLASSDNNKSDDYSQAISGLKHHESVITSFKAEMMHFKSELENILHLTFDNSIRDLDELSLEIQNKCRALESSKNTKTQKTIYGSEKDEFGFIELRLYIRKAEVLESIHKMFLISRTNETPGDYKEGDSTMDQTDTESSLNHSTSHYKQKLLEYQHKIEFLNAQLNKKKDECLELNAKNQVLVKESTSKDIRLLGLKNINEAMIKKLQMRDSEISQIKSQFETKDSENLKLRSQYQALDNQFLAKDSEVLQLISQYQAVNIQLLAKDSEMSQLRSEYEATQIQLLDKNSEISKILTLYEATHNQLLGKVSENIQLRSQLAAINSQLCEKITQESQLLERINSLKIGLRDIKNEFLNLKQANQNLVNELKRYQHEVSSFNTEFQPYLHTIETQIQLNSIHTEEFQNQTQVLKDANKKLVKELRELQGLYAGKMEESRMNQQSLLIKNQEAQTLQTKIEELTEFQAKTVAQYEKRVEELHKLRIKDDTASKAQIKHYEETILSLEGQVDDLNSEIITLKAFVDCEKMNLEQHLLNKDEEMLCLSEESKNLSYENSYTQEIISNLRSEKQRIINSLQSANSVIKNLESDLRKQSQSQSNFAKIKASQDLDIERLRLKYEDLYSLMVRSYEDYIYHYDNLHTPELCNVSTDSEIIRCNVDNILKELDSPSSIDCIYIAKRGTRSLVSYNLSTKDSTTYLLNNITYNFKYTSTCAFGNGDVLIAGGCHPATGDTYLFRAQNKMCYKLCSLIYPRGFISLIYHNKKVYAFGGSTCSVSKKAEEYDISTNYWKELPDMIQAREGSTCISLKNKIYIIGGGSTNIEEFSIDSRIYRLLDFRVSNYGNVAALVDDKIYIIGQSDLFIADKHFSPLDTREKCWDKLVILLSNVVIDRQSISYFNHWTSRIERLSLHNYERKDLVTL